MVAFVATMMVVAMARTSVEVTMGDIVAITSVLFNNDDNNINNNTGGDRCNNKRTTEKWLGGYLGLHRGI